MDECFPLDGGSVRHPQPDRRDLKQDRDDDGSSKDGDEASSQKVPASPKKKTWKKPKGSKYERFFG